MLNWENPSRISTEEASAEGRDPSAHPLSTCNSTGSVSTAEPAGLSSSLLEANDPLASLSFPPFASPPRVCCCDVLPSFSVPLLKMILPSLLLQASRIVTFIAE